MQRGLGTGGDWQRFNREREPTRRPDVTHQCSAVGRGNGAVHSRSIEYRRGLMKTVPEEQNAAADKAVLAMVVNEKRLCLENDSQSEDMLWMRG